MRFVSCSNFNRKHHLDLLSRIKPADRLLAAPLAGPVGAELIIESGLNPKDWKAPSSQELGRAMQKRHNRHLLTGILQSFSDLISAAKGLDGRVAVRTLKLKETVMIPRTLKMYPLLASLLLVLVAPACKKKAPIAAAPPPPAPVVREVPPPPKPPSIVEFSATPPTIERGQSSTLRWSVRDATEVSIEPAIGAVSTSGTHPVAPSGSSSYALRAEGPGGVANAIATLTVTAPPIPAPTPPKPVVKTLDERVAFDMRDVFFDYDRSNIRADAQKALADDTSALKAIFHDFPDAVVVIEGHCDERGSAEYNIALGDRRGSSARDYFIEMAVPADKLKVISYGKERPQCTEANETCWQKNRRVHFVPAQKGTQ